MFHIHQSSTVIDYVERFSTLFNQLKAYQPNPDLHYYTTRFVDGLRHDIRMVVALQHPFDLDTAYTLALLQEEMADSNKKSEFHTHGHGASFKLAISTDVPPTRPLLAAITSRDKPLAKPAVPATDDKLSSLWFYRQAHGLCEVYVEQWFRGHKCAPTITLHYARSMGSISARRDSCQY
jgi:hypothetical protein